MAVGKLSLEALEEEFRDNEIEIIHLKEEAGRHLSTYQMCARASENESSPESLREFWRKNRKKALEAAKKFQKKYETLVEKNEELSLVILEMRLEWLDLSWGKLLRQDLNFDPNRDF